MGKCIAVIGVINQKAKWPIARHEVEAEFLGSERKRKSGWSKVTTEFRTWSKQSQSFLREVNQ